MFSAPVTDSASDGVAAGDAGGAGEEEYPAAVFPPYDGRQLRALRERLRAAAGGAPASALALSAVPEPGLYALAAALAGESGASGGRGELAARLCAELHTRNCRGRAWIRLGRCAGAGCSSSSVHLRLCGWRACHRCNGAGCPAAAHCAARGIPCGCRWRWRGGSASLADAAAGCWSLPRSCWRKAPGKGRRPYSPALSLSFRSFRRKPATGRPRRRTAATGAGSRFRAPPE